MIVSVKPVLFQTIKRLSNSLSKECLDPNAIVRLYWPKTKCALIRDEVVLVDR